MRGSKAAYDKLLTKDIDTLYFIYEEDESDGVLYLGERMIASGNDLSDASLADISDILLSEGIENNSFLAYDSTISKWVNKTLEEIVPVFIGADEDTGGIPGLVPGPTAGQTNLFLRSDGKWASVETSNKDTNQNIISLENTEFLDHEIFIANSTKNLSLIKGDIFVVKDLIANNKYSYTAYVYNGNSWVAMDGNYNAKNVYFDTDFIFTENIGTVEIPDSGSIEVAAAGKNIEEFMTSLFMKEKTPITIEPSIEVQFNHEIDYEVGTKIGPSYKILFKDGSYTYGTATTTSDITGSTITSCEVTSSTGETKSEIQGTFSNITIEEDTEWKIEAKVIYSDGLVPLTNLGNDYPEGQIKSKAITQSSEIIKGHRSFFYGMIPQVEDLNSDIIRSLTNGGAYNEEKTLVLKASDYENAVIQSIIAIPESNPREGLVSAELTSAMNVSILSEYKLLENLIEVEGNEGYTAIPYRIYVYSPATGIGTDEVHTIKLG